jgi:hypothetical protein
MMPKVYCVTEPITYKDGRPEPLFDVSPAAQYGEIVFLAKHNVNMFASVPMVRYFREQLKDFSDEDCILPVGDPVTIAAVAAIAADINEGKFKILKWDKKQRQYFVIEIDAWGNAL